MSQSALKALEILEFLAIQGSRPLGVVATGLHQNKSTTYRMLQSLVEAGYVRQRPDGREYEVTGKLLRLASKVLQRLDTRTIVRPVLEETTRLTREASHLAVLDRQDLEVIYVDKVDGDQAVAMASRIGSRAPCHSSALGKVLLAAQPEEVWSRYALKHGLPRRTPRTITTEEGLVRELRHVREAGFALDDCENEEGIRCVAVPIYGADGVAAAAMSISGWTLSMTSDRTLELVPVMRSMGAKASNLLGFEAEQAQSQVR